MSVERFSRFIGTRVAPDLAAALMSAAHRRHMSPSQYLRSALAAALAQETSNFQWKDK